VYSSAGLVKVFPRDRLPYYINPMKTAVFVVNTDPSHMPGRHWVGL
jgi:hypothetical protein